MKVENNLRRVSFRNEDGEQLIVRFDNRGEPFREGIEFELSKEYSHIAGVFLENYEAKRLRDLLNTLYPVKS